MVQIKNNMITSLVQTKDNSFDLKILSEFFLSLFCLDQKLGE